ncbi:unnamed protein product [Notodromas monacha]|uniref:Uncharacterized protein n=1 Tax=Notodromas monacha TaxID=399045 RepID=A0A7R9BZ39_9CRUS|nr:unnamed protein product [Notodromas monacha]CAG0923342.1 unnamed protein product [Notodromas monacha]
MTIISSLSCVMLFLFMVSDGKNVLIIEAPKNTTSPSTMTSQEQRLQNPVSSISTPAHLVEVQMNSDQPFGHQEQKKQESSTTAPEKQDSNTNQIPLAISNSNTGDAHNFATRSKRQSHHHHKQHSEHESRVVKPATATSVPKENIIVQLLQQFFDELPADENTKPEFIVIEHREVLAEALLQILEFAELGYKMVQSIQVHPSPAHDHASNSTNNEKFEESKHADVEKNSDENAEDSQHKLKHFPELTEHTQEPTTTQASLDQRIIDPVLSKAIISQYIETQMNQEQVHKQDSTTGSPTKQEPDERKTDFFGKSDIVVVAGNDNTEKRPERQSVPHQQHGQINSETGHHQAIAPATSAPEQSLLQALQMFLDEIFHENTKSELITYQRRDTLANALVQILEFSELGYKMTQQFLERLEQPKDASEGKASVLPETETLLPTAETQALLPTTQTQAVLPTAETKALLRKEVNRQCCPKPKPCCPPPKPKPCCPPPKPKPCCPPPKPKPCCGRK